MLMISILRSGGGGGSKGGGGGGEDGANGTGTGGNGGSGVVIIKEPEAGYIASSCWDLRAVYRNVKAGTWTN